jgi:hypothetical protein
VSGERRWAVVDFWYYASPQGGQEPTPPAFSIQVFDEQPMFE